MNPYNTVFLLLVTILSFNQITVSQVAILPWGGDAMSESGSVSYSLGQAADEHFESEAGNCNEGVQQPFIQDSTTGFVELTSNPGYFVAPNPFKRDLMFYSYAPEDSQLQYSILDITGRTIANGIVPSLPYSLQLPVLPDGFYVLILKKEQIIFDVIKLIKSE